MCMYSLHDKRNTRKAKVGETLTKGEYRHHDAFLTDEGPIAPMLACIRHDTKMVIDNLQFVRGTAAWIVAKYTGESLSVTFIDGTRSSYRHRGYAADCILLPDGQPISFHLLANGVTARIPRKVRKDKGITRPRSLDKVFGLDHIAAILPPDPKPEDADAPSSEPPVEPVEPAKEPAPADQPAQA